MLIFLGPSIFTYTLKRFYGDDIQLERVTVSPKLELGIARATLNTRIGQISFRGVNVKARVALANPQLVVNTGPLSIAEVGWINSTNAVFSLQTLANWNDVDIVAIFSEAEAQRIGATEVRFEAGYSISKRTLYDISFSAHNESFYGALPVTFSQIQGSVSDIAFEQWDATSSKVEISASADKLISANESVSAGPLEVNAQISPRNSVVLVKLMGVTSPKYGMQADSVDVAYHFDDQIEQSAFMVPVKINKLKLQDPLASAQEFEVNIGLSEGGKIGVDGSGLIEELNIKTGKFHVGTLTNIQTEFELLLGVDDDDSNLEIDLYAYNSEDDPSNWNAKAKYTGTLDGFNTAGCSNNSCDISVSTFSYGFETQAGSLVGAAHCATRECPTFPKKHQILVRNTDDFFAQLPQIGFSPLVLPIAYYEIIRGEKFGDGHKIDLDIF